MAPRHGTLFETIRPCVVVFQKNISRRDILHDVKVFQKEHVPRSALPKGFSLSCSEHVPTQPEGNGGMGEGRRQLKDDQRINIFSEQNMSMYKYKCAATSILFLSVNTDYIMTFLETREEGRRERDKDNGRPKLNLNLNLKIFKVQPKRRAMLSHGDH